MGMDWSDEYWIRVYVTDSSSFIGLSWQAKGLFFLIARKVNAAGRMGLTKGDPVKSSNTISLRVQAAWHEIRPYLLELLRSGAVRIAMDWSELAIPNFVAAQTAQWNARLRQKQSRSRRQDCAKAEASGFQPGDPTVLEKELPKGEAPVVPTLPGPVTHSDKGGVVDPTDPTNSLPGEGNSLPVDVTHSDNGGVVIPNLPEGDVTHSDNGGVVDLTDPTNGSPVDVTHSDNGGVVASNYPPNVTGSDDLSHTDQIDLSREEKRDTAYLSRESGDEEGGEGEPDPEDPEEPEDPGDEYHGQLPLLGSEASEQTRKSRLETEVERVYARHVQNWRAYKNRGPEPKFTAQRKKHVLARIREFGPEVVLEAVDRMWANKWRRESGYVTLEHTVRSAEQLEMIMNQDPKGKPRSNGGNGRHQPVQQAAPKDTYKGSGVEIQDGKIVHKDGRVEEIEADPMGLGIDFAKLEAEADTKAKQR
jgi:hypothetical protein